jgi:hypothetical protein
MSDLVSHRFWLRCDLGHDERHIRDKSRNDLKAKVLDDDDHTPNTVAKTETCGQRRRSFDFAIWLCIRSAGTSHGARRLQPTWQARLRDIPLRFSVSQAIVFFSLTTEVENL